jgi:cytochrome oxidase Cu insertion factor (SCO1/SenC/PrrC family)
MKRLITLCIALTFGVISFAQMNKGERPDGNYYGQTTIVTGIDEMEDFTIIDSDGNTLNLYQNLEAGKTVILDLFFST